MTVEQNIRLYPCAAALGKGLGELSRKIASLKKVLSESYRGLGGFYIAQHDRKRITVEQDLDAVAGDDRRVRVRFNSGEKSCFAESDPGNLLNGNDFGAPGEK
jgi:hypothetical protein